MKITVPGAVYRECFDPDATTYPREAGLPEPTWRRVGRGSQFSYSVSDEQARDMLAHAYDFGIGLSYGVDDPSVGRRVARWASVTAQRLGLEEGVLI